jgi:hypothetical protein
MIQQQTRIKQLLWSRLHPAWPEYELLFTKRIASTPQELLKINPDDLCGMIRSTSRGKLGALKAQEIRKAVEKSVGIQRDREGIIAVVW